ncbi:MAG: NrtA/SsuA/CpmA family ABC transporter substrate-binding protein [Actinobacteria bacterium]|nr:NrtA/SsuA/CpmA family ABC transporter substrate-binding protein [Actinomycetota bacterium]
MKRRGILAVAAVLLSLVPGLLSCGSSAPSRAPENLTVAAPALEQNALLYVATSKGFFADHGLDVTVNDFATGVASRDAMLSGTADIAELAEFPLVAAVLQKEPVKIIASNDEFENDYLVARKDRGIESISDLRGKRVGLALGTINEFYLGRLLDLHGLTMQDVTLVDLKPGDFISSIVAGDVDALVAWQPYLDQIQQKLPDVNAWPAQSSQQVFGILVVREAWLSQHRSTLERFLLSLRDAEDFLLNHPAEAKAVVKERLSYDEQYVDAVWPHHDFAISLSQSLLTTLKDEAQWVIDNHELQQDQLPDFSQWVSVDALKAVKPESIDIVGYR